MSRVKKESKARRIFQQVAEQVAEIYLYLLIFYALSSLMGYFFERWELFFNWPAFHTSIIILGVLSLFSAKGKKFLQDNKKRVKKFLPSPWKTLSKKTAARELLKGFGSKCSIHNFKKILVAFKNFGLLLFRQIEKKAKNFHKKEYLKIIFILLILIILFFEGAGLLDSLILGYGLAALLFIFPISLTAVLAGLFFIFCPILTIFKQEALTGQIAVYGYYFLLIAVATQIRIYLGRKI